MNSTNFMMACGCVEPKGKLIPCHCGQEQHTYICDLKGKWVTILYYS